MFAREAGATEGPPIAAKRLPPRFPVEFELSEADSMLGQPFPDSLLIEARLDSDGDPTTRPPTDPKARADNVKTGSHSIAYLFGHDNGKEGDRVLEVVVDRQSRRIISSTYLVTAQ